MTAAPVPRRDASQPAGARCEFCRRPLPARHRHLLDTERCAVFCTCPDCSAAARATLDTPTARPLRTARAVLDKLALWSSDLIAGFPVERVSC